MDNRARWTVEVTLDENSATTRAQIRLTPPDGDGFVGIGVVSDLHSAHPAAIAPELAIARALSHLTEEVLEAVAVDIEAAIRDVVPAQRRHCG